MKTRVATGGRAAAYACVLSLLNRPDNAEGRIEQPLEENNRRSKGARMGSNLERGLMALAIAWGGCVGMAAAADIDADAAQALLKKSDCGKCHSVDKKKDGPSYKETAARLKGKAGAEDELYKHLTTGP
ncbi:MAG TPA: hypothetical protein VFZ28_18085, partial [Burkholderiaceae bacterium]|nr:hypothetical protein [Burkholderiaceae bacterium]